MRAYVIIDAGTGGGKCIIFDAAGSILGAHRQAWTYDAHVPEDVPFVTEFSFSAPAFWDILSECIRAALRAADVRPGEIAGVAATSQREGCVFLDPRGVEVYAGPNIDARGFREGLDVLGTLGPERLYRITGHSAPFIFPLARYLWFRTHRNTPVAHLLMINDWITWRLSGQLATEPSNATESMLFDLDACRWSEEILSLFDIPPAILPPVRRGGDCVGAVTAGAARATGLAEGTPVFVGGADTQCSLLGSGAVEPGQTAATLGTTTPVQTVVAQPTFDPQCSLWAGCHVVPQRWVLESNAGDTGDAYLWLLDLVGGTHSRDEALAIGDELGADGFAAPLMAFVGPTVFNLSKLSLSRPGGMLFPFPALHVRPDRRAFVRGFMESIGYAIRGNLEQLDSALNAVTGELILSGGMSRSAVLTKAIADVTGIPVHVVRQPESAALGCALLIMARERGDDLATTARAVVRHDRIEPDAEKHARYAGPYAKWRELSEKMHDLDI